MSSRRPEQLDPEAAKGESSVLLVGRGSCELLRARTDSCHDLPKMHASSRARRWRARLPRDAVIEAYKADVDRTLIRKNLQLTPEQRMAQLEELAAMADELRRAARQRPATRP